MTKAKLLIGVVNGSTSGALGYFKAESIGINNRKEAKDAVDIVDAFILTGGGDVDPKRYDNHRSSTVWGIDKERDELEFWIVEQCKKKNIPIMGICRGNQLLNVAMGGSLFQDISEFEEASHWGYTLSVNLNRKSGLGRFLQTSWMRSSHYHHQAIDRLGEGLMPSAWSLDGFIEAMESWPGVTPFILGTQFHPEMDWHADDDNEAIFAYFLSKVVKRHKRSAGERRRKYDDKHAIPTVTTKYGAMYDTGFVNKATPVTTIVRRDEPSATQTLEDDWQTMGWYKDDEYESDGLKGTVYRLDAVDNFCSFPPCRDPWACEPASGDCLSKALCDDEGRSVSRSVAKRKEITE